MTNIRQKLHTRRAARQFERALDNATPAMRNELVAIATRQNTGR